jgi:uncharacterized protein YlxW (UPF0749 family)
LAIGTVSGVLVYNKAQETAKKEAALRAEADATKAELDKLNSDLKAKAQAVKDLEDAFGKEKDERKKAELQAALNQAKAAEEETKTKITKVGGPAAGGPAAGGDKPPAAKPVCTCKSTDPLCDCL